MNQVFITAHRGNSEKAPENTISALNLAILAGADYAEVDVQQLKDGSLVLFHDYHLQRVARVNKNIWDFDYEQLQELDVGSWFHADFTGEKVPSLAAAIDAVQGKLKLNLELKLNGHEVNLAQKVVEIIREKNFQEDCVISSFDYPTLMTVRQIAPEIKIGKIIAHQVENISEFDVDFYAVCAPVATVEFINAAHQGLREVHVWTINEVEEMKQFISFGVDNLITNRPEIAKKLR
ncbi:MAG: hypothetical protein DSM107014_15015 [Gomphosphaeria aponina SAG 52.96 = DSM 107014]|uniref:GP-PDE domain-containing protein n=1 Tax=Gomphosphaeria aponina SAG 52.96 = DSM 107014 TaxID=1521640 RepID=A0A941JQL3_9CHRO|nr:hypothetical protein [Gomphosphaeria aponina SAG 52.96 = DSM 107014]